MRAQNMDDPANRPVIQEFFGSYFYADWLDDPSDRGAALQNYLQSETYKDPGGRLLLQQVQELRRKGLGNDELTRLIEGEWRATADAKSSGFTYQEVLDEIEEFIQDNNQAP